MTGTGRKYKEARGAHAAGVFGAATRRAASDRPERSAVYLFNFGSVRTQAVGEPPKGARGPRTLPKE
ncbi:MAG: hypothetical protein DME22_09115 [Verrucomicrobia bacterium]|nr:MAG: hypothetical protein DME22_09115 [Verrucomicrobiota bacterium]PYJ97815.1 MAG: hypothetical protein DME23_13680 [Verrucomicrobiota bacterium]